MAQTRQNQTVTLEATGPGTDSPEIEADLERLAREDVLGQLLQRQGRMRDLGTEGGDAKLDWVDGVERALAQTEWLAAVEEEAAAIIRQGIRHVIWSGMGGSIQTVHALKQMGYLDSPLLTVHPQDSTDPTSLNRMLYGMAAIEQVPLPGAVSRGDQDAIRARLRVLLERTMMIGVSMGMTSEEPITHLEWFDGLLSELDIPNPGAHIQVMTLPGSYLDQFARARGSAMAPIQLDGQNHTPGRMSAPATRVFLRPVALTLAAAALHEDSHREGRRAEPRAFTGSLLQRVLLRGQELYGVSHSPTAGPRAHLTRTDPFVRLGAYVARAAAQGRNKVVLVLPPAWRGLAPWLEQLVEESLGKGGKGFLIFYGQDLESAAVSREDVSVLQLRPANSRDPEPPVLASLRQQEQPVLTLTVPVEDVPPPASGLGEIAGLFLCFKKTVAVFGYLHDIVFAGQPAVEAYKKYARDLREAPGPVAWPAESPHRATFGSLALDYSSPVKLGLVTGQEVRAEAKRLGGKPTDAAAAYAALLSLATHHSSLITHHSPGWFRYHDMTWNGELSPEVEAVLSEARQVLVNGALGLPGKLRRGPSDYHSTEQSEVDGPPELVSLRLVALAHEPVIAGAYSDKFLLAQARGTWQAMEDAGRWVVMGTLPDASAESLRDLAGFFAAVRRHLPTTPARIDRDEPPEPGLAAVR